VDRPPIAIDGSFQVVESNDPITRLLDYPIRSNVTALLRPLSAIVVFIAAMLSRPTSRRSAAACPGSVMPATDAPDEEIRAIIAYLKSLRRQHR
jgi:hypothetical protein